MGKRGPKPSGKPPAPRKSPHRTPDHVRARGKLWLESIHPFATVYLWNGTRSSS